MTIQKKFIILPIIIGFLSLSTVFFFMYNINFNITQHMNVNHPRLIAVFEMEININEAASETYLEGVNRETYLNSKEKFQDAIDDFTKYFNIYKSQAIKDNNTKYIEKLEKEFSRFINFGEEIFELNNEQYKKIIERRKILNNSIEVDLDDNLQLNLESNDINNMGKLHAADEIEINMHELISAVRGYLLKNDAFLKERIADSLDDLKGWITTYEDFELNTDELNTIKKIKKEVDLVEKLSLSIVVLEDRIIHTTSEFEVVHVKLDYLMDEVIQKNLMYDLEIEAQNIEYSLYIFFFVIIFILLLLMIALFNSVRPILKSINELIESTIHFSKNQEIQIPSHSEDELGMLSKALESMMHELLQEAKKRNEIMSELQKVNAELESLANTDSLTKLYNRRYFFEHVHKFLDMSVRENKVSTILMLDIDKFKNVNDTFGHDIGDKILQDFAKVLSENIRKGDIFARFGGEEFIVFLPHANYENALVVAEKIRSSIETFKSIQNIKSTVSIGISEVLNDIDITIKEADTALYKAKENGRNRVECYAII